MNLDTRVERPSAILAALGLRDSDPEDRRGAGASRFGKSPESIRGRILLVEDDRAIRGVLAGILEEEGYSVTVAENGRQALDKLRGTAATDLIVLDLRMPVMDGWQFRAAQKSDPELAGIPVLAVSADGSAQAAAIDAAVYLRKPLSTDALLRAIGRILAEAERRKLLGRLEEAERFAAIGRIAASVGHQINNPLAYVSMNVDLVTEQIARVLEANQNGDRVRDELEPLSPMLLDCRMGLDRIRDIVKDLQHLSHQANAKRVFYPVNEVLNESLAIAGHHLQGRATVRKEYGTLPALRGDRAAIGQVFLNLLLNAANAVPEGQADSNVISLRTTVDGEYVTVEIADTGIGIPAHVLPHIFDPFFTTKSIGEGAGLGLAVSCRIIADHGGRIDVHSKEGKGSVFRVALPILAVGGDESADEDEPVGRTAMARARILVVDDMAAIGQMISVALPEHEVTVVQRAADAFTRLAANEKFDLVICDVLRPDVSGRDVLERLEMDWPQLARKLIFMTGGAFTAEARELLGRCKPPILSKPFSIDELRSVVVTQLEGSREPN